MARTKTATRRTATSKTATSKTATSKTASASDAPGGTNVVVLQGECSAMPVVRELESGRRLASVSVRVRDGAASTSVPVTVWEPPVWVEDLAEGDAIVVVGSVRRRFFRRAGGVTGSQTDVEAAYVARGGSRRARTAARRRVDACLDALDW